MSFPSSRMKAFESSLLTCLAMAEQYGLSVILLFIMIYSTKGDIGEQDKPQCPYDDPRPYTLKSMSDDLAELLKQLNIPKVVVIGHDW